MERGGPRAQSWAVRSAAALVVGLLAAVLDASTAWAQPETGETLFPPELVQFTPHDENPVFEGRGPGHWDARIRERGWVMREDGQYRMWYTGYQEDGPMKLGYATSPDGLDWKRWPDNPIYDQHWVEDMMLVKHEGVYYMFAEGLHDRAHLLTSEDGIQWTRRGTLDVRQSSGEPIEEGPYGTPTAWFADGTWYLLYERRDQAIWLATSEDMDVWTNVQDDPVLRPGPGAYDRRMVAVNQLIRHHDRYYIYYHGLGETDGNWTTNVATSTDLIHWTKYADNPLLPVAANKSSGILVHDGDRFRLYTMHAQVNVHFSQSGKGEEP